MRATNNNSWHLASCDAGSGATLMNPGLRFAGRIHSGDELKASECSTEANLCHATNSRIIVSLSSSGKGRVSCLQEPEANSPVMAQMASFVKRVADRMEEAVRLQ